MTIEHTIEIVAKLNSIGTLISTAEYLLRLGPLKDSGLMSWSVARLRYRQTTAGVTAPLLDFSIGYPGVVYLLTLRFLLAAITLLGTETITCSPLLLLIQGALSYLFIFRSRYGHDGADQMSAIVVSSLGLALLAHTHRAEAICLWFLTLQLCLSYCVAGIAKVTASGWRDGSFLTGVCGLSIYGNAHLARFLMARPRAAKWLSRGLLAWETVFPLVLIAPPAVCLCLLACGAVFHLINACVLGLNTFVWSFAALYPAVLFCVYMRPW